MQVNETLTIDWESAHPRVLWDGGEQIAGSSCVSCGHCVTVCPCNALMEKSMLGHAGYLTNLPASRSQTMIKTVKAIEPETGYGPILALSAGESAMRKSAREADQDGVHVLWRRLLIRCVDTRPAHSEN